MKEFLRDICYTLAMLSVLYVGFLITVTLVVGIPLVTGLKI